MKWLIPLLLMLPTTVEAGNIYGGVTWKPGYYHTLNGSELSGTMIVQPQGVLLDTKDPNRTNLGWLFTTATNRGPGSPEFYAVYTGNDPEAGNFGLWAWSCTAAFPCWSPIDKVERPSPFFMFNYPLKDYPQYVAPRVDDGGHRVHALQFINRMEKLDTQLPPRWRYSLLLWNHQTLRWDTFWSHERVAPAEDCADDHCGNSWGPIIEVVPPTGCVAPCSMPKLREIGWEDMQLKHDGGTSTLPSGETVWWAIYPEWSLFHRRPNRGYTAGSLMNAHD